MPTNQSTPEPLNNHNPECTQANPYPSTVSIHNDNELQDIFNFIRNIQQSTIVYNIIYMTSDNHKERGRNTTVPGLQSLGACESWGRSSWRPYQIYMELLQNHHQNTASNIRLLRIIRCSWEATSYLFHIGLGSSTTTKVASPTGGSYTSYVLMK
eukprot:15353769-Ditylum_brightwellii.AAC.1